ncbi:MAG TPA: hypothetical protein VGL11_07745 [Candidatus Binatia bacterium]|jgi:hypothetical protein
MFEHSNENGQFVGADECAVFRVLIPPNRPKAKPSLAGRRAKRATDGVSKRLCKIVLERAIRISDKLHSNDRHAA